MTGFSILSITKHKEILSDDLQQNINFIITLTGNSSDFIIRKFQEAKGLPMAIVYINGLTDTELINDSIMNPILSAVEAITAQSRTLHELFSDLKDKVITVNGTNTISKIDDLISALYKGDTVILADGLDEAISASSAKWVQRGVEEE